MGLSFLRGFQSAVPRGPDPHQTQPARDPDGPLADGRVRVFQKHHQGTVHPGLPPLYAGGTFFTHRCERMLIAKFKIQGSRLFIVIYTTITEAVAGNEILVSQAPSTAQ